METQCVNGPRILKPLLELKTASKPGELQDLLNNKAIEVVAVFTETKPKIHVVIRHKYPFELDPIPVEMPPQKKAKKDREAQKAREELKEFMEMTFPPDEPPIPPPPTEPKPEILQARKR